VSGPFSLTVDEQARISRIDELVARVAVSELIETLSDSSWTVRRAAVAGLAALGDDAVAPVCAWLATRRTSEHAIAAAVDALVASIGVTVTAEVTRLAAAASSVVVEDAARILGRRRDASAIGLLVQLVLHASDNVALAAIEALGEIGGSAAVEVLIGVIRARDFFRAFPAMQVAARTGDPRVVAPIAELLGDDLYRDEAARALGRTGSALAIPPLAGLLADPGEAIVTVVAAALDDLVARAGWAGSDAPVVEAMRRAFHAARGRFVTAARGGDVAATRVLGAIGDAATIEILAGLEPREPAVDAIRRLVRDDEAALEAALALPAIRAVALLAVSGARSAPTVRALLADDDAEVRARACEALARIGDTSSVPALFAALADPSPRVAYAATAAIDSLGTAETPKLAIAALASSSSTVRRQALRIIAYLGCREAFDVVVATIGDPDVRLAELAVAALASCDDPRVDVAIEGVASSAIDALRAAAVRAAGQRGGDRLIAVLLGACDDPAPWVRYYACQGLGRLRYTAATDRLVTRLTDSTPHVRIVAIEALAHLDSPVAWQALAHAARSTDPEERRAALIGIANDARPAAIELLVDAAASDDRSTRLVALAGLALADDPRALERLADAIRDPSIDVRDAALSLVADRPDRAAAELLLDAALVAPPEHPAHAALSRPTPARVVAIAERLAGASDVDATVLASALARMTQPQATRALFDALAAPNPSARRAAATALVAIGAAGAEAAVRRLAADDPDLAVRRACAAAIGR
jgi:HEAT repeat protein